MKSTPLRFLIRLARPALLAAMAGAVIWGVRGLPGRTASPADTHLTSLPADAATALQGPFETTVAATGRLQAHRTVSVVSPDFEGKVVFIAADGAAVKQGDVLCRFDDTEFRRELQEAILRYENARAELAKSIADRSLENRNTDAQVQKLEEELRILKETNAQLLPTGAGAARL